MWQVGQRAQLNAQQRLFLSLADQLARPLLTVSRLSELASTTEAVTAEEWRMVQAIATSSLRLIEGYTLSLRVHGKITPLQLEPVTVSSLLYDTAERLAPFAKYYGVAIELDAGTRTQPIIADRLVLQSAFESLGQVFVMSQAETEQHTPLRLSAHRGRYGMIAGCYSETGTLGADSLRRARAVQGNARQPLEQLVSGPAAGVFVADSLLQTLAARLHVARYRHMSGLAVTLQLSQQLQLV
jgi:hypothetical protein